MRIHVLHLGLSYACNMRCSHCFADRSRDILKKEDFFRLIDELYDMGLFVLYYTYGEPLYCPFFFEAAEYVKKKGIVQVLMTNGYLLDQEMAQRIRHAGISKAFVSLDHIKREVHDANRGLDGAYDAALQALKHLKVAGVNCGVATTVTEQNADCLLDIEKLADTLGINNISFLRVRADGEIVPFEASARTAYEEYFQDVVQRDPDGRMFHDMELLPILTELYKDHKVSKEIYEKYLEMNRCHVQYTVCVEPNGDVSRCNLKKQAIGNVVHQSLKEILSENQFIRGSCGCGKD